MFKIAKKDIFLFFSDKKAFFLSLLLPIGLITLFALAFGGVGADEKEPSPVILLYTDLDESNVSQNLIKSLDSIPGILLEKSGVEDGLHAIQEGDRIAQFILEKGFEQALINKEDLPALLRFDQSREMEVSILQNLIAGRLADLQASFGAKKEMRAFVAQFIPGLTASTADSIAASMTDNSKLKPVKMESVVGAEESNWGLIQAVAGTAIMMLLFSVSALGASIIEEKEQGVLKRLLQSPVTPDQILLGKLLSAFVISMFQLIIMFTFSWLVLGLDIEGHISNILLVMVVTAICCSSLGIFLASIADSKRQVDSMGTIVILFMSAIGGSMIPIYIMPTFMQDLAVISINYWCIQAFYDIFWRDSGMSSLIDNIIILTTIALIMTVMSVFIFRRKAAKLN